MRSTKWNLLALFVLLCALAAPLPAQDFWEEEFSNDQDPVDEQYEPTTRDPLADPNAAGLPPIDWHDARDGWVGVIEENLSPLGDVGYPPPDPGADTPEYAIVQPEATNGPYWAPSSFDQDCWGLCFNIDIYADPLVVGNANGVEDGWWTNAVGTSYVTETGFWWTADEIAPGTWTFATTTSGAVLGTVPVGAWYEMEVCIYQGVDGTLDATHSLWDATHSVLIGSYTATTLFLNPVNQLITPGYSWLVYFESNMDVAFVDDFKVECIVPEPSSIALLGLGAIGLVAVVRRRRGAA